MSKEAKACIKINKLPVFLVIRKYFSKYGPNKTFNMRMDLYI